MSFLNQELVFRDKSKTIKDVDEVPITIYELDEKDEENLSAWQKIKKNVTWTKSNNYIISGVFLITFLIGYFWWPHIQRVITRLGLRNGPWWKHIDPLLLWNHILLSTLILLRADIRRDFTIVVVGFFGGLMIESWGTQTDIWFYYTKQRPPLWIIPAWPLASLAIDRLVFFASLVITENYSSIWKVGYWFSYIGFLFMLFSFVWPTIHKSFTIVAILICFAATFVTPLFKDYRLAVITFLGGSAIGVFLEWWGTTRRCWTYYTYETPPIFAIFAHGMAAVCFWRGAIFVKIIVSYLYPTFKKYFFNYLPSPILHFLDDFVITMINS